MSLSGFEKKETEVFKCFANAKEANVTIEEYLSYDKEKLIEYKRKYCETE